MPGCEHSSYTNGMQPGHVACGLHLGTEFTETLVQSTLSTCMWRFTRRPRNKSLGSIPRPMALLDASCINIQINNYRLSLSLSVSLSFSLNPLYASWWFGQVLLASVFGSDQPDCCVSRPFGQDGHSGHIGHLRRVGAMNQGLQSLHHTQVRHDSFTQAHVSKASWHRFKRTGRSVSIHLLARLSVLVKSVQSKNQTSLHRILALACMLPKLILTSPNRITFKKGFDDMCLTSPDTLQDYFDSDATLI